MALRRRTQHTLSSRGPVRTKAMCSKEDRPEGSAVAVSRRKPCAFADDPQKGITMSANALSHRATAVLAAAGWLAALCLAVLVARSWQASRKTAGNMRAAFAAQDSVLDQIAKRERQRDSTLTRQLTDRARVDRGATAPAAIAARLPLAFLPLPRPVAVSLPARSSTEGGTQVDSQSPALITVPQADLKPLLDQLDACRACAQQLTVAQQDLEDEHAKVSSLIAERDAAAKAARGGGFWNRVRLGAKWFLIGGAAGALAASAARR